MLKQSKCSLCGRKITVSSQIEHGSYKVRPVLVRRKTKPDDEDSVCYDCFKNIVRCLAENPDALLLHQQLGIFA